MLEHVSSGWDEEAKKTTKDEEWGLYLKPGRVFKPNPLGRLRVSGGAIYERRPREVPLGAIMHDSVFDRIRDEDSTYAPDGLFQCNTAISELRDKVSGEVVTLKKTNSLSEDEASQVEKWVNERLTIQKWSKLRPKPQPSEELRNG